MRCFETISLYGTEVKIQINNKEKLIGLSSKILTTITIIIILSFLWIVGNDIFFKTNPFSYINSVSQKNHPKITINKKNFPMAFSLISRGGVSFRNKSFIEMKVFAKTILSDGKTGKTIEIKEETIKLENCTYSDFPKVSKEEFDDGLIATYLCPKFESLDIEGYWNNNNISFFTIVISKCTGKDYCAKMKDINDVINLQLINFSFVIIENIISFSNYNNPISNYIRVPYKYLHPKNKQLTNFMVEKNRLITDKGYLGEDLEILEYLKFDELQTDTIEIGEFNTELLRATFYSSNISEEYNRKYIKIHDIIASLSGLIRVMIFLLSIINRPFSEIDLTNFFLDNLLNDSNKTLGNIDDINYKANDKIIIRNNFENDKKFISIKNFKHEETYQSNQKLNQKSVKGLSVNPQEKIVVIKNDNIKIDIFNKNFFKMYISKKFKKNDENRDTENFNDFKFNENSRFSYSDFFSDLISRMCKNGNTRIKLKKKKNEFDKLKMTLFKYFQFFNLIKNLNFIENLRTHYEDPEK